MPAWVQVPAGATLAVGAMTAVSVGRNRLILFRTADGYCATDRRCTHQGADLMRGYFDGRVIECPVHQGRFAVHDGCVLGAPASRPLRTYPVRVVGGEVYVEVDEPG